MDGKGEETLACRKIARTEFPDFRKYRNVISKGMDTLALQQLSALAHPQRLSVFRLLMRRHPQAVPAGDIALALDVPRSTLSPYLSALNRADLISQQREGTSLLYRANMEGAGILIDYLLCDCARGRPGLSSLFDGLGDAPLMSEEKAQLRVLFLCTGNSARSILAEVLLRDLGEGRFASFSAGTVPNGTVHPMALRILQAKGHAVDGLSSKTPEAVLQGIDPMDLVLTVCDSAASEECPILPGYPLACHWGLPDPSQVTESEAAQWRAFEETYSAIAQQVTQLVALPLETLNRAHLQEQIDQIASASACC